MFLSICELANRRVASKDGACSLFRINYTCSERRGTFSAEIYRTTIDVSFFSYCILEAQMNLYVRVSYQGERGEERRRTVIRIG